MGTLECDEIVCIFMFQISWSKILIIMFLQYQIPVDIMTFKTPDEEICMTVFMNMKDFAFTVFLG